MRHDWRRVLPGTIPPSLTRSGTKRFFFAQETYFRECWRALEAVWADEPETMLQQVGFVLCRPDAIELLLGACDSLILFVRDERRGASACERIAQLKGPAFPMPTRPRLP